MYYILSLATEDCLLSLLPLVLFKRSEVVSHDCLSFAFTLLRQRTIQPGVAIILQSMSK